MRPGSPNGALSLRSALRTIESLSSPGREARAIESSPAPRVRQSEAGREPVGAWS